ncbi:hypothetical protein C7E17_24605, partial [Stenotrophomonas maltophilia]
VLQESTQGNGAALEPGLAERLHQSLAECVSKQECARRWAASSVQEIAGMSAELPVFTLNPQLERVLQESTQGNGAALEPGLAERLHQSLAECVSKQE